jgi:hypothetical protein
MKWDIYKAKAWMLRTGMEHIEGGLFAEGGEMVYEAKWGDGCDTLQSFYDVLKDVCCWDDDLIEDAIKEAMQ